MIVDCIQTIEQFDRLRPTWDGLYASDPQATIFSSWPWLRGWLDRTQDKWLVLAVRPSGRSSYVALLPLAFPVPRQRLSTLGNPLADHIGMLCRPEYEDQAILALAAHIHKKLPWDQLWLVQAFDPRLKRLIEEMPLARAQVRRTETPCPYIDLPETWEQYLKQLKSDARRKLRRTLEPIENDDRISVTMAHADDLEQRIETLLTLWQARWGQKPAQVIDGCRATFRRCFENDSFYLATVWHTDTPIAAVACLVDRVRQTFSGYICSWDARFSDMSPGIMGWALSVQDAIQSGMKGYDFLRGDERYKYVTFGAVDRLNESILIARPSLRSTAQRLLERGVSLLRPKSVTPSP